MEVPCTSQLEEGVITSPSQMTGKRLNVQYMGPVLHLPRGRHHNVMCIDAKYAAEEDTNQ